MALKDDLITRAEKCIADLEQDNPFTRDKAKEWTWDLIGLKPAGLHLFSIGAQWLQDLAEIFQTHKDELHPWVTVYAAALGMQGVWSQIVMTWINNPTPQDQPMHPKVRDAIDTLIPNYLRLVS